MLSFPKGAPFPHSQSPEACKKPTREEAVVDWAFWDMDRVTQQALYAQEQKSIHVRAVGFALYEHSKNNRKNYIKKFTSLWWSQTETSQKFTSLSPLRVIRLHISHLLKGDTTCCSLYHKQLTGLVAARQQEQVRMEEGILDTRKALVSFLQQRAPTSRCSFAKHRGFRHFGSYLAFHE